MSLFLLSGCHPVHPAGVLLPDNSFPEKVHCLKLQFFIISNQYPIHKLSSYGILILISVPSSGVDIISIANPSLKMPSFCRSHFSDRYCQNGSPSGLSPLYNFGSVSAFLLPCRFRYPGWLYLSSHLSVDPYEYFPAPDRQSMDDSILYNRLKCKSGNPSFCRCFIILQVKPDSFAKTDLLDIDIILQFLLHLLP